uniref:Selectin, platelet (p-selectin) ligand n=1 Tax=Jaculus jaculus TaxID=51337 RepID=A0A8C5KPY3_JACJA
MSPHLLLLLASLGPGNCLQLWDTWGDGAEESPGPALSRARRQVDDEEDYDDYFPEATEPSQTLQMAADPEPVTMVDLLEQRASVVPGSPNLTSVETATRGLAGLDARGDAVGRLSTGLVTQWQPTTVHLATELTSVPATREVLSMGLATTEAETMQPATTKAETTQPAATEAETTRPAATEAETTRPAATEAETTRPAATEAETTQPASTEAETTRPASTEAETTWPAATEFLPRKPKVIGIPFIEPAATSTTMSVSEESTDSVTFLGPSVTHKDNAVMNEQVVTPGSSVIPSSTGTSDRIPVRQCLLAILILALLVTIFLVCTVVLAVRLSRKNHTYPVRNYSPTEMVCISSLLPDGGEEAPIMANGDLPKSQGHTAGPTEDRDGDDLTLHSFLP